MKRKDKDSNEEGMRVWSLVVFVFFIIIFLYVIIDALLKVLGVA